MSRLLTLKTWSCLTFEDFTQPPHPNCSYLAYLLVLRILLNLTCLLVLCLCLSLFCWVASVWLSEWLLVWPSLSLLGWHLLFLLLLPSFFLTSLRHLPDLSLILVNTWSLTAWSKLSLCFEPILLNSLNSVM